MTERNIGISQEELVSRAEKSGNRPRKLPQYIAGLSATLGALAAGLVMGWSSPAGQNGVNLKYSFEIDSNEFSWVSSIFALGAAVIALPVGILTNLIGRRRTLLLSTVPYTIGWSCVIWPNSVVTLILGRLFLGFATGAFSITVPMYTGEIADKETRGRLGTFLELNYGFGLLSAYILGLLDSMHLSSLISAAVPLIFFATFFFMPETPTYLLMKGNVDAARETLIWLRGSDYDVESELDEKRNALEEAERNKVSFFVAIKSRAARKGLLIAYGLLILQQSTGMGPLIFYGDALFAEATGEDSGWPMIVVSSLQICAVLSSGLIVDNWGRRLPLFLSGAVMCIASLLLGVYLYFNVNDKDSVENLKWVPLICVCVFVVAFDFGIGPIPWMMVGELFSPHIKGIAASSGGIINSFTGFIVGKTYVNITEKIGAHGAFWIFSSICALSVVFSFFMVPETKGKTLEQIQIELGGSAENQKKKNIA